jgi:hypothetical protein
MIDVESVRNQMSIAARSPKEGLPDGWITLEVMVAMCSTWPKLSGFTAPRGRNQISPLVNKFRC